MVSYNSFLTKMSLPTLSQRTKGKIKEDNENKLMANLHDPVLQMKIIVQNGNLARQEALL